MDASHRPDWDASALFYKQAQLSPQLAMAPQRNLTQRTTHNKLETTDNASDTASAPPVRRRRLRLRPARAPPLRSAPL